MRAFVVPTGKHPPAYETLDPPHPGPGEVRVRVAACGLNFADLLMMAGTYQETPPRPFVPGMELAGVVERLGPGVTDPVLGARVAVVPGIGGLAELAVVPAARCLTIPDSMTMEQAAGFQIAYGTAHLALDHRAALRAGETLLVLGAAGGVGLAAVEVGMRMGARVIASARGPGRLDVARRAGAHHLIDSDSPDLRGQIKALGGADVVFDPIGGPAFLQALRATRPEGRLLTIGYAGGDVPQIPANLLLVKNLSVIGVYWGGYLNLAPNVLTASLGALMQWFRQGNLHPHISHILPFDRIAEGFDLLRNRTATGKVVITTGQGIGSPPDARQAPTRAA